MVKRIVVCCDGTWNTPDQTRDGRTCPTNVTKVALAVAERGADGVDQRLLYHRGVGANRWERLRGGAVGFGLSRHVRDAYEFVVDNFEPGDELFFFGFSRGAYTARSTVGLIRNSGILRREHAHRVHEAYALYRSRTPTAHPRGTESALFRRSYSYETRVRFIGVWDTVGALGIPLYGPKWANIINRRWQFHDTALSTSVDAAFQALAIDERRGPFQPTLWASQGDAGTQRVEQVWFSGDHCDVGGGHPDTGLADIALLWLVDRARACGLTLDGEPFTADAGVRADPMATLHDSRKGLYRLLRPYDRVLGLVDPQNEYVASTVLERSKRDADYSPTNLTEYLAGSHQDIDVST